MIETVRLPIQTKQGHVAEGLFSYEPEGYGKQLDKLNGLLACGYRVIVTFPIEDRLFKGVFLILYKDSPQPDQN